MSRLFLLVVLTASTVACTSFRPVTSPVSDALLMPGDRVRLVTTDGERHEFRIAVIDSAGGTVQGDGETIAMADVTTLEKRERSWVKTGLLIGGLVLATFGVECEGEPCGGPYGGGFFCCP